tara:strand:- start:711 stop:1109 length:399 start_codon:yes stop_codon:yes gene_type:complete
MKKVIEIFIPTKPVSASRPRFGNFSTYYSKSYMAYRKDTHAFLKTIAKKYPIKEKALFRVDIEFLCYKPKRPSNKECPRYDIDNLCKSPLDAITYAKMIWNDDIQILEIHASKRYQEEGEPFGTKITITEIL